MTDGVELQEDVSREEQSGQTPSHHDLGQSAQFGGQFREEVRLFRSRLRRQAVEKVDDEAQVVAEPKECF